MHCDAGPKIGYRKRLRTLLANVRWQAFVQPIPRWVRTILDVAWSFVIGLAYVCKYVLKYVGGIGSGLFAIWCVGRLMGRMLPSFNQSGIEDQFGIGLITVLVIVLGLIFAVWVWDLGNSRRNGIGNE